MVGVWDGSQMITMHPNFIPTSQWKEVQYNFAFWLNEIKLRKTIIASFHFYNLHQMVLKLCLCSRYNISSGNPERADQPKRIEIIPWSRLGWLCDNCCVDLKRKKMISIPLMMENPVRSPMVPPMRLSWASILIFLSLSMSSKVAVSKKICTSWRVDWGTISPELRTLFYIYCVMNV